MTSDPATRIRPPGAPPLWNGLVRCDGLAVRQAMNDCYEIVRRPGGPGIDRCPPCGSFLLTEAAAKRTADWMWPAAEVEAGG